MMLLNATCKPTGCIQLPQLHTVTLKLGNVFHLGNRDRSSSDPLPAVTCYWSSGHV